MWRQMEDSIRIVDFKKKSTRILDVFGAFLTKKSVVLSRISRCQMDFTQALKVSLVKTCSHSLLYVVPEWLWFGTPLL